MVYFNNEHASYFRRQDVSVRVGVKETDDPISVCYCFGYTRQMILNEMAHTGHSTTAEKIKAEVKAGNCACEIKNPSGRCCLGDVVEVVKQRTSLNNREVLAKRERFSQASNE
jgi:NAD(P)H-nitrite reductase large subunit